jgi:Tol biopolymer transport system component
MRITQTSLRNGNEAKMEEGEWRMAQTGRLRIFSILRPLSSLILLSSLLPGCVAPAVNPRQPVDETEVLADVVQLTKGFESASDARMSPDGRWVAFQAKERNQPPCLFIAPVRRDGEGVMGLGRAVQISTSYATTSACFSQDGKSLFFAGRKLDDSGKPAGSWSVFRADGWEQAVLSADASKSVDFAQHVVTASPTGDLDPSFSDSGSDLFFTRLGEQEGEADVYVVTKPFNAEPQQLTAAPGYDGGARVSPDGARLVYRANRPGTTSTQLYAADVVHANSGYQPTLRRERQLTFDKSISWNAAWHPSGKYLVYARLSEDRGASDLFLMRPDGRMKTRVTRQGRYERPSFSADGKYLLWTGLSRVDGTPQLFVGKYTQPQGL